MDRRPRLAACVLAALVASAGCASAPVARVEAGGFDYFTTPRPTDAWTPKIAGWQSRERQAPAPAGFAPASVSGAGAPPGAPPSAPDLREKYAALRREWKRMLAREVAAWIQREARLHYRPDGPIDHWATLEETLDGNGDDCDGLELLVYRFLRDLGFQEEEVYRAIVYRPSDGQHHMVTLWFETPEDPWVIDPTGAMTSGMPLMSEVPGWVPLKVFSEDAEFTVLQPRAAVR
jgi:predicted transglutaminase-like cysteine proteinase